ncbi:hypothetical protein L1987_16110 [Smallanthus sonchifolius]|uniref:Uncharacterized protein n=1 Tax=Smallanthus sonchifolius TaxID=185202 RepID=A0ACB9J7B8_9ASTR|nr:hypothetical protein L1987_16110 [Smallanthus sonchifolius]
MVVFDDIWDCRVWNDLKMYFPDDKTGSRILFTRRDIYLSLHVQSARSAHVLRLRTEVESWDIFEKNGNMPRYDMVSLLELRKSLQEGGIIHIDTYKYLRILDLVYPYLLFPLNAVHDGSPHASISNLVNLQMLIISSRKNIDVPKTIWNLLKLLDTFPYREATRSCNHVMFPRNLKNLTLSNTGMDWEEMWSFSFLPNLEILKLKFQACIGERWGTEDVEFGRLKVLKLHDLDIKRLVCLRDNFPRLQRLVVHRCLKLCSVPTALREIFTLEVIEVNGCNLSAKQNSYFNLMILRLTTIDPFISKRVEIDFSLSVKQLIPLRCTLTQN